MNKKSNTLLMKFLKVSFLALIMGCNDESLLSLNANSQDIPSVKLEKNDCNEYVRIALIAEDRFQVHCVTKRKVEGVGLVEADTGFTVTIGDLDNSTRSPTFYCSDESIVQVKTYAALEITDKIINEKNQVCYSGSLIVYDWQMAEQQSPLCRQEIRDFCVNL